MRLCEDPADRALAERLVRSAGAIALELRGGAAEVKGAPTDVVTAADTRAEAALLELLRSERPGDGVLGEEGAAVAGGERRWLLDPVDGTLNYARGLPAWCSAVCLVDGDGALACAVFDPVADELFSAGRGQGATLNGAPLRVPDAAGSPGLAGAFAPDGAGLAAATVATFVDARRRDPEIAAGTERLLRAVGALRAVGCGTLELAWIAAGRLDGWIQAAVEPWDWHPGALLVAEAGGAARVAGRWHAAARAAGLLDEILAAAAPR
jgi:myo-inositol-1(or 4)-monophosphatase